MLPKHKIAAPDFFGPPSPLLFYILGDNHPTRCYILWDTEQILKLAWEKYVWRWCCRKGCKTIHSSNWGTRDPERTCPTILARTLSSMSGILYLLKWIVILWYLGQMVYIDTNLSVWQIIQWLQFCRQMGFRLILFSLWVRWQFRVLLSEWGNSMEENTLCPIFQHNRSIGQIWSITPVHRLQYS